jgi:hypothetical protein
MCAAACSAESLLGETSARRTSAKQGVHSPTGQDGDRVGERTQPPLGTRRASAMLGRTNYGTRRQRQCRVSASAYNRGAAPPNVAGTASKPMWKRRVANQARSAATAVPSRGRTIERATGSTDVAKHSHVQSRQPVGLQKNELARGDAALQHRVEPAGAPMLPPFARHDEVLLCLAEMARR